MSDEKTPPEQPTTPQDPWTGPGVTNQVGESAGWSVPPQPDVPPTEKAAAPTETSPEVKKDGWERELVTRLATDSLVEQRKARRWTAWRAPANRSALRRAACSAASMRCAASSCR